MNVAALILAAMGTVGSSAGEAWTPVSFGNADGHQQLFLVNRRGIVRDGNRLKMEMTMIRERPSANGVDRVVERSVVDCKAQSSQTIDALFLGKGDQPIYHVEGDGKVERYAAGSAWQILIETV